MKDIAITDSIFIIIIIIINSSICTFLLKLISNSSSSNKGNYDRDDVWISDLN